MKILRVKKTNFYDVFLGNGWTNHSRVKKIGNLVFNVSGIKLSKILCVKISKQIGA